MTSRSIRSVDRTTFVSAAHRYGGFALVLLYIIACGSAIATYSVLGSLVQEPTGGMSVLMDASMALHAVMCATGVVLLLAWTAGMTIRDTARTSEHATAHQSLLGLLRSRVEQHTDWLYWQVVAVVPGLLLVCVGVIVLMMLINDALTDYASPSELSRAMVRWIVWFVMSFAILCEAAGVWVMYIWANRNAEAGGTLSASDARKIGVTLVGPPPRDYRRSVLRWQLRALVATLLLVVFVIAVL